LTGTSQSQTFTIDNLAPTPIPQFPLNQPVYAQNITFNFTATDDYAPDLNCSLTVDGSVVESNIIFTNNTNQTLLTDIYT